MHFYTDQIPGRTVHTGNTTFLYFSGTAYLGMPLNREFQELISQGMARYGSHYGSSRTSNLKLSIFEETEAALAMRYQAPEALVMSSGFLAGQLIAHWLRKQQSEHTLILYAPETHPAISPSFGPDSAIDFAEWKQQVYATIAQTDCHHLILVSNAVDSIRAIWPDFTWLSELPFSGKITLILDDSHGVGINGTDGWGSYISMPQGANIETLLLASLGKAIGIPAGVIAGSPRIIQELRHSGFYAGASPASPAFLWAFLHADHLYRQALSALRRNIAEFSAQAIVKKLFDFSPGYPVFFTREQAISSFLIGQRVLISSFPYPHPHSPVNTRVVINSLHTHSDLAQLSSLLEKFGTV
jgi:7-keto-8-aminopelargonate synthetase-like enzyme